MRNQKSFSCIVLYTLIICSCSYCTTSPVKTVQTKQILKELSTIDSLLRDEAFAESIAKAQDSAYYKGIGEPVPPFLKVEEENARYLKTYREEKIAINLAGFYALECGVGMLSLRTGIAPVDLLDKISKNAIDSGAILLLNRFANATWKAGQPFRGLERIKRDNFRVANFLNTEEVNKDYIQIKNAAIKLRSSLQDVTSLSMEEQMKKIRKLFQDTAYAVEMATFLDSSYAHSQNIKDYSFLTPGDDTSRIQKSVKEIKIATNLAGFYALECALSYLATKNQILPSTLLQNLVNNTMIKEDQMIFARFANATWKAGQPFRGLERIQRATFTPFYFLNEDEIEKDIQQQRSAAKQILPLLKYGSPRSAPK